ncbi:MAG: hypothetical protein ACOH2A_10200 [Sphingobacteriaceae bacterium]
MATVTEKDIIGHLKEKIKFHQQEVKKIENVLTAFTGNPIVKDDQAGATSQKAQKGTPSKANTPVAGSKRRNAGTQARTKVDATAPVVAPKPAANAPVAAKKAEAMPVAVKGNAKAGKNRAAIQQEAAPSAPVVSQDTKVATGLKTKSATPAAKEKVAQKKSPVTSTAPQAAQKPKAAAKPATSARIQSSKSLEIPSSYSDKMTINSKIAFALNEIGEGYNEDIANAMAQYEPQSDAKKLSKQISGILSTLKNKGFLTAKRDGRKDKYALVK